MTCRGMIKLIFQNTLVNGTCYNHLSTFQPCQVCNFHILLFRTLHSERLRLRFLFWYLVSFYENSTTEIYGTHLLVTSQTLTVKGPLKRFFGMNVANNATMLCVDIYLKYLQVKAGNVEKRQLKHGTLIKYLYWKYVQLL